VTTPTTGKSELKMNTKNVILLIIYILIVYLVLASHSIYSQERKWVVYHADRMQVYYYDVYSVSKKDSSTFVLEKIVPLITAYDENGNEILYEVLRIEFICYEMKCRGLCCTTFLVNGSQNTDNEISEYHNITPNSLLEELMNAVCKSE
jgi:hypothetical protein